MGIRFPRTRLTMTGGWSDKKWILIAFSLFFPFVEGTGKQIPKVITCFLFILLRLFWLCYPEYMDNGSSSLDLVIIMTWFIRLLIRTQFVSIEERIPGRLSIGEIRILDEVYFLFFDVLDNHAEDPQNTWIIHQLNRLLFNHLLLCWNTYLIVYIVHHAIKEWRRQDVLKQ